MVQSLKLRLHIIAALTFDKIRRISISLTTNSHPPIVHVDKVPRPNNPPYHMYQAHSCLSPRRWFQKVVSVPHWVIAWNYSKPIIDSHRHPGASQPLHVTKPPSHRHCCSLLNATSMWPWVVCSVFLPWAVSIYNKLLISSVQCWVLCVWPSPWPRVGDLFLTMG